MKLDLSKKAAAFIVSMALSLSFVSAAFTAPSSESEAIKSIQGSGLATSAYLSVVAIDATTKDGKQALKFTVKNISNSTLHLNAGILPWSWPRGVNILVAAWRWGDYLPIAPPPPPFSTRSHPGFVDLKPGESIEGLVPLDQYVTGFDQARKKGEVVVTWWTEIWDDKKRLGKFGGWVDYPKTAPGDVN